MNARCTAAIAGALLALLAGCGDDRVAAPPPPTTDHDIVFEGYPGAFGELMVLDLDTGAVNRLLPPGTQALDPQPSPDGARIAFAVADYEDWTGDIFVVDRDGGNLRRVTTSPFLDDQPAWSPDGRRLVFRSFRAGRLGDIWTVNLDGGEPVNLTPDSPPGVTDEHHPAWSPRGDRIAYVSTAGGTNDIWTMAADGSAKRRLTDGPEFDTEPAWSPAGDQIAYRSSSSAAVSDIALLSVGGGDAVVLVLPGIERMPVWSPDGGSLIVVHHAARRDRPELFRLHVDGVRLQPLAPGPGTVGSLNPAVLPRR